MARTIDYYFTLQSPWTHLGHAAFARIAAEHDVAVRTRPVRLPDVFAATGGKALAERHLARQRYRLIELQRWIEARGVPMKLRPAHWPFPPALADRCVIAAGEAGEAMALVARCLAAVFEREEDLGSEDTISAILAETGFDPGAILSAAKGDAVIATYAANTAAALEAGVVGSPCYVLDGEPFWGQDRLPLLDRALRDGRAPFRSDV